jgi:hypothetical protein
MRIVALLLPLGLLSGCETFGAIRATGVPVPEAHAGPQELRVLDVASPLRRETRIPVLSTPEVFAAYVPSHAEADRLIGEHWIFFKLRDAEWFTERLANPDPPAHDDAPPESLRPLRGVDWSGIVVPQRRVPDAPR